MFNRLAAFVFQLLSQLLVHLCIFNNHQLLIFISNVHHIVFGIGILWASPSHPPAHSSHFTRVSSLPCSRPIITSAIYHCFDSRFHTRRKTHLLSLNYVQLANNWTYVTEVPLGCTRWRQFDEAPHAIWYAKVRLALFFCIVSLSRRCALSPTSSVSVASSVVSTVPPRWPDSFSQSFSHSCACSLKMQDVKVQHMQSAVYEWLYY